MFIRETTYSDITKTSVSTSTKMNLAMIEQIALDTEKSLVARLQLIKAPEMELFLIIDFLRTNDYSVYVK